MRTRDLVTLTVAVAATTAAWARPALGPGTRALALEFDRDSGRVRMGDREDRLGAVTISATVSAGRLLVSPEVADFPYAPTHWRVDVARVNRVGVTTRRELPLLGVGLPPVALAVDHEPLLEGEHLRVQFSVDAGGLDASMSAPEYVPPLPVALLALDSIATLSIDGRDGRLPIANERLSFDLDVPATVVMRVEDARGLRWMRRSISAEKVARPVRRPSVVRLRVDGSGLEVGTALLPLPLTQPRVTAAGRGPTGAWATLQGAEGGEGWRAVFGGRGPRRVVRFGVGAVPAQLAVRSEHAIEWVELAQTFAYGMQGISARMELTRPLLPLPAARWSVDAEPSAGRIVWVGTPSGGRVMVAVPDGF